MIVCIVPGAGQSHCSVGCFYFYLSLIENSLELDGGGYNGLTRRDGQRKSLKGSCERCVGWQLKDLTPWNPSFVNFQTFTWEASVKQKCLNTPLISPLENGKKKGSNLVAQLTRLTLSRINSLEICRKCDLTLLQLFDKRSITLMSKDFQVE